MVASVARRFGMKPVLVLVGKEPDIYDGYLLLDKLLSAEIHFREDYGPDVETFMKKLVTESRMKGRMTYIVVLVLPLL